MRLAWHQAGGLLDYRLRVRAVGQDAPFVSDDPLPAVALLPLRVMQGPVSVSVALQVHRRHRLRLLCWIEHGSLPRGVCWALSGIREKVDMHFFDLCYSDPDPKKSLAHGT